jgi:hypothetical protein
MLSCPYCGSEMESGYLAGGGLGIAYYPFEADPWNLRDSLRCLISFFSGNRIFRFGGNKASHCSKCRKIILDY